MAAKINNRVKPADLELVDKLVGINRVTKVTKGGRTFIFSAIVVVGNENGIVGQGLGKANEVTEAISCTLIRPSRICLASIYFITRNSS